MKKTNENNTTEVKKKQGNGITELVFVIDRSGSMAGFEADTAGGFNSMIERQSEVEGEVLVSTVLFDSRSTVLHDRIPIDRVQKMRKRDFCVGGCTALLDALGDAITHIGNIHKYARPEDVPENTVFVITTDGMENASREYSSDCVKEMIEYRKRECGWDFIFLAANIDAVESAGRIGIGVDRAANYDQSAGGFQACYSAMSDFVAMRRCAPTSTAVGEEWKKKLKK